VTPTDLRTELPAPVGDAVATLVTTGDLRAGLLALAGIAVALLVLERARRAAGRGPAVVIARLIAPIVGGALVALVLARALAGSALEAEIRTTLTTGLGGGTAVGARIPHLGSRLRAGGDRVDPRAGLALPRCCGP